MNQDFPDVTKLHGNQGIRAHWVVILAKSLQYTPIGNSSNDLEKGRLYLSS